MTKAEGKNTHVFREELKFSWFILKGEIYVEMRDRESNVGWVHVDMLPSLMIGFFISVQIGTII